MLAPELVRVDEMLCSRDQIVDVPLRGALLHQLQQIERASVPSVALIVEPHVEGLLMTNAVGLPGYAPVVIERHLRALLVERLIENGGLHHPVIGIYFIRLTRLGRRWLLANSKGTTD